MKILTDSSSDLFVQSFGRSYRFFTIAFIRDYAIGSSVREIGKITWTDRDRVGGGGGVKQEREEKRGWREARLHGREEDARERPTNLNFPYHQNGGALRGRRWWHTCLTA